MYFANATFPNAGKPSDTPPETVELITLRQALLEARKSASVAKDPELPELRPAFISARHYDFLKVKLSLIRQTLVNPRS